MKSMAEYALENKALIKLFIAFLVIGGLWSFYSMSKMEDPEITVKQALVMTVYPGATANLKCLTSWKRQYVRWEI